jgi:hypothetical protein
MWVPPISLLAERMHIESVRHRAHLTCAFPDGALNTADKLGDMARGHGLAAWTRLRGAGEWEIRIEGDEERLRNFAADIGFRNVDAALTRD